MKRRAFFSALVGSSAAAAAAAVAAPTISLEHVIVNKQTHYAWWIFERVRALLGDDHFPGGEVFTDDVLRPFLIEAARRNMQDLVASTATFAAWSRGLWNV